MKSIASIAIFLLTPFLLQAQVVFKTLVPQQPVVAGESFQVQYIFREAVKITNFKAPSFAHFRFVSGPNQYSGSVATARGEKPLMNFVYTLEAIKPGRFMIPGAIATVNGKSIRSTDVTIDVISKERTSKLVDRNSASTNSDDVLQPGEDPYKKIRQNLLLKVMVDRSVCFVGEPVLATFKLYSRLESKSDIIKNPGFYGFTVYDMINLADKQLTTENIDGKIFEVHTIRKVQLYPLQAGSFNIDAMEVMNKVEFSRITARKKTEQEIAEDLLTNNDENKNKRNTELVEMNMRTEPVMIIVKPIPEKNRPVVYNGAVGSFSISASAVKNRVAKNEEGIFEITVSGNGNFTQLNTPVVEWPVGMEGFAPVILDSLDKTKLPLSGCRKFRYAFICSKPGQYQVQPVSFSFLDPGKKAYKTVSTPAVVVEISNEEKRDTIIAGKKVSIADTNDRASRVAAGIIISLVIIILTYWITYRSKPVSIKTKEIATIPTVDEVLTPARQAANLPDTEFFSILHRSVWEYMGARLGLEGSRMNKDDLVIKLQKQGVEGDIVLMLQKILMDCEAGMFTAVNLSINKDTMLMETKIALESINKKLF